MAKGDVQQTPWIWEDADFAGNVIRITVTFDNGTRVINGCTVFRDAACVYRHMLIGLGGDGTPDTSPRNVNVPAGTTVVPVNALNNQGLTTIEDVLALQITAGR